MNQELRKNTKHTAIYDGIAYEIQNFEGFGDFKQSWTFYLWIDLSRIPDEKIRESLWLPPKKDDKGRVHYDYYANDILSEIKWHCGITWYSKESGIDGAKRLIKVGCDFQHYWDEGRDYDLRDIQFEAIEAAKSFRLLVPDYQYYCHWNGILHDASQIKLEEDGTAKCIEKCTGHLAYLKKWPKKPEAVK